MKPKKNFTKDLNRKRGLFFILVLAILLTLLYVALEWKTPFDNGGYDIDERLEDVQRPDSSLILRTKATKRDTVLGL